MTDTTITTPNPPTETWSVIGIIIAIVLAVSFTFGIGKRESIIGKTGMVHLDWP